MATMCPEEPRQTEDNGAEKRVFYALESGLPEDYYVFHGMQVLNARLGMNVHEIDFVIFQKDKGILVIEVKSGQVYYANGIWHYETRPMEHGGPFVQATRERGTLLKKIQEHHKNLAERCKFMYAVWFPDVTREDLKTRGHLPPEADTRILLTEEDMDAPKAAIDRLFAMPCKPYPDSDWEYTTDLNQKDADILLDILAPSFTAVPLYKTEQRQRVRIFKELLNEQVRLLNYLEEQPTAVIQGRAGTGKTVMAVTKARRHALQGERVLFLTFNRFLCARLKEDYGDASGIDFYNIDRWAAKYGNSAGAGKYTKLLAWIEHALEDGTFPWPHVIIDEGQDFGQSGKSSENGILDVVNTLWLNALDESVKALRTFYVFYDRCQLVQGTQLPDFIQEADCKLTLYMNCRNTKQIAGTSELLLRSGSREKDAYHPSKVYEKAAEGERPEMYFAEDEAQTAKAVDALLGEMMAQDCTDIVILTCRSEKDTRLASRLEIDGDAERDEYTHRYRYRNEEFPVTTCRKFKGLEADGVILIDVDRTSFDKRSDQDSKKKEWDHTLLPYVGATRAKFYLGIVANLTDDECNELLRLHEYPVKKHPKMPLANYLFHASCGTVPKGDNIA
ncbi:nuclease-related domain-containing DEAD/DEAH box helicase [uncultured Selenomonas sp.]|uniref:nuclease-related domain-containing DEAD/DEAH box helicase n=1 Tax=uncultured Selenomonas sp. TaxID=159275 RepID=UPI0025CE7DDF|nr:NERD domain-containing protein [uncultured Selenomonas sp.]